MSKVNKIITIKNYLTPSGRNANKEIKNMRAIKNTEIHQRNLPCDTIALKQDNKTNNIEESTLVLLNSTNTQITKRTQNTYIANKYKLFSSIKEYIFGGELKKPFNKKEILYNLSNGKIEEKAEKIITSDGATMLVVRSAANRKTEFPSTKLGRSLHPAMLKKEVLENGDTLYIESYPHQ